MRLLWLPGAGGECRVLVLLEKCTNQHWALRVRGCASGLLPRKFMETLALTLMETGLYPGLQGDADMILCRLVIRSTVHVSAM